jgi:hypothetical protein
MWAAKWRRESYLAASMPLHFHDKKQGLARHSTRHAYARGGAANFSDAGAMCEIRAAGELHMDGLV